MDTPEAAERIGRGMKALKEYMEKTGKSGAIVANEVIGTPDASWTSKAVRVGTGVMENLDAIARVTGVSAAYLFCGVDTSRFVTIDQVREIIRESRGDAVDARLDSAERALRDG